MQVTVDKMTKKDLDGVCIVENDCFPDPWSKNSFINELKNEITKYFVVKVDDEIAGYIGAWFIIDEAHITNVAIKSKFRGQGLSNKLIETLIEECLQNRIKAITLEVRKSNVVAQSLYQKFGFIKSGIRKEYYSDNREDALIMWKQGL